MLTKYEDNFGFYCIDDDDLEELEFFCDIRARSEPTICVRSLDQKVRLLTHVTLCATCSEALEYGAAYHLSLTLLALCFLMLLTVYGANRRLRASGALL